MFIGGTTCIFAATIACVQTDIKRVIAYSTCSQLGYMFMAAGAGAYQASIFHLITHAFFKALLFLCAGSVIHAMSDEQDMRKMGGIWRKVPVTYVCMWIGSLAIAGVPFFAGYWSKDAILETAYVTPIGMGGYGFWMGTVAAFLTAFYSWRLLIMTFHGTPRAERAHHGPRPREHAVDDGAADDPFGGGRVLRLGVASGLHRRPTRSRSGRHRSCPGRTTTSWSISSTCRTTSPGCRRSPAGLGSCLPTSCTCSPRTAGRLATTFRPLYHFLLQQMVFRRAV